MTLVRSLIIPLKKRRNKHGKKKFTESNYQYSVFKRDCKKSGLGNIGFARSIGQCDSYVKNVAYTGRALQSSVNVICSLYGADEEKLTTTGKELKTDQECNQSSDPVDRLDRIERKIDSILYACGIGTEE